MSEAATVTRPSARPIRRTTPNRGTAKHHLEPNPFEKSFSSGPVSSESVERNLKDKPSTVSTPPLSTRPGAAYRDRTYSASKPHPSPSTRNELVTTPKPLLPPISNLASPAVETAQYPWSAGLTSSLRSGPLSPAMLAGPQSSHFDPNSFRTGFTPDLSNFKTGLTPLGGGPMNFPPPSPNTAAFLAAMVNNTSSGPSTSAAAMTPNTLAALTGNAAAHADTNNHVNGSTLSTHPQNMGKNDRPSDAHNTFDLAFSRTFGSDRPEKPAGSKLKAQINGDTENSSSTSVSPQMMQKPLAGAAGEQQNAASGLFLLSRAHQELSKRADASPSTSLYDSPAKNNKKAANKAKTDDKPAGANNKRKKSASLEESSPPGATKAPKTAKAKKTKDAAKDEEHDMLGGTDDGWDSENGEDGDDGSGKGRNSDDKRKNFLERNRQAALKCRQRKKAWLNSLQAKVEYLQNDNENLQNTVGALRNENMFLKSQLVQATGGAPPPGMQMGMHMGMPMGPPGHPNEHHGMMAPHPAYMHPGGTSGPPMSQAPNAYAVHRGPGFSDRPRPEADEAKLTDQPVKHERDWSATSDVSRQSSAAPSAPSIKV